MNSDLYLNLLWLVPPTAWFAARNRSRLSRNTIIGASLGLVVSYALKGLYALYFVWPVSDLFGQCVFYLRFFHDLAGVRVALVLQFISADSPLTDHQQLLIEVVKAVLGGSVFGLIGFLWSYLRHRNHDKSGVYP